MRVVIAMVFMLVRMVVAAVIVAVRVRMCHWKVAWLNWRSGHYIHI
jgi:hypothetical protein